MSTSLNVTDLWDMAHRRNWGDQEKVKWKSFAPTQHSTSSLIDHRTACSRCLWPYGESVASSRWSVTALGHLCGVWWGPAMRCSKTLFGLLLVFILSYNIPDNYIGIKDYWQIPIRIAWFFISFLEEMTFLLLSSHPTMVYLFIYSNFVLCLPIRFVMFFLHVHAHVVTIL